MIKYKKIIDFLYRYPDTVVVGHDLARLDVPGGKQALPAPANPRLVHVHALDTGVKKILLWFYITVVHWIY